MEPERRIETSDLLITRTPAADIETVQGRCVLSRGRRPIVLCSGSSSRWSCSVVVVVVSVFVSVVSGVVAVLVEVVRAEDPRHPERSEGERCDLGAADGIAEGEPSTSTPTKGAEEKTSWPRAAPMSRAPATHRVMERDRSRRVAWPAGVRPSRSRARDAQTRPSRSRWCCSTSSSRLTRSDRA